jgi:hypothetical protein
MIWRFWSSPITVAAFVLLMYELWFSVMLPSSYGAKQFTDMGESFVHKSTKSPIINAVYTPQLTPRGSGGYDGQFVYYIALDPARARYYIDVPAYRYGRILLPILARLVAGGAPSRVPYAILYVNLAAVAAGTLAVAAWLRRRDLSPWIALVYGFYPGIYKATINDLTEVLAYGCVAIGMYFLSRGTPRTRYAAIIAFACGILSRESVAVFPIIVGLAMVSWRAVVDRKLSVAAPQLIGGLSVALIPLVPYALYKLFLTLWLGDAGAPSVLLPTLVPFQGLYAYRPWDGGELEQIRTVVLPGVICGMTCLMALVRRGPTASIWLLLANVLLFVILLNKLSYGGIDSSARISTGVALAAIYALPDLDRALGRSRWWFGACCGLWLPFTFVFLFIPVLNAYIY